MWNSRIMRACETRGLPLPVLKRMKCAVRRFSSNPFLDNAKSKLGHQRFCAQYNLQKKASLPTERIADNIVDHVLLDHTAHPVGTRA